MQKRKIICTFAPTFQENIQEYTSMFFITKLSKKNLASENIFRQIFGALIQWRTKQLIVFIFVSLLLWGVTYVLSPKVTQATYKLLALTAIVWLTVKVCSILTDTFSLRKKESNITLCQSIILIAIGLWILGFIVIFDIENNPTFAAAFGIVGLMIGWIFQDRIKGIVAFFHLRMNHLLSIDDWIMVPSYDVDGEVKHITLTTITIYNWDTTTSTIPIYALHDGHFKNLQNMTENRTYGRRMKKTFIFDTSWFRPLTNDELNSIKEKIKGNEAIDKGKRDDIIQNIFEKELREGMLNAELYRMYIYHWLMNNPHISQQPSLLVHWTDHTEGGMMLEVYTFITDGGFVPFEWQQSKIIEHILTSMDWFGLRLYQSPSAYDASNSNIYLTQEPASYTKEINHD